nr:KLRAQ motif containing protein 1 [Hymenolepis microstoma]
MGSQDQSYEEELLRSKYARLGVEFKKLRERHRVLKDSCKESNERLTHLESKLTDQNIHMRNLEQEKESLIFRNQHLVEHAAFLEKQLEVVNQKHGRSASNEYSVDNQIYDNALKTAMAEVNRLHEDLVAQSSQFLARIKELESTNSQFSERQRVSVAIQTPLPNLSPFTQSSSSVDAASSSLDALCLQDIEKDAPQMKSNGFSGLSSFLHNSPPPPPAAVQDETLQNPPSPSIKESIYTMKATPNLALSFTEVSVGLTDSTNAPDTLSQKEKILLERISQLESQLAEISLKQRLEVRRCQISQQMTSGAESNCPSLNSPVKQEPSVKEKLLVDYYETQLQDRTKQLTLYAGRVADAYAEIRSLNEHLRCTRKELERQRRETSAAITRADSLEEELEMTKQHTAQQLTEMAQHLANLTDDIYALRGGSNTASPTITSTSSASKISSISNSIFSSLLKRNNHSIDFWSPSNRDNSSSQKNSRSPFSLD